MTNTTIYLKDYKPPLFEVLSVHLEFELYEEHTLVKNCMQIKRLSQGPLYFFGDSLELLSIALDGAPLSPEQYHLDKGNLVLEGDTERFTLTLETKIYPKTNTALSGLYRSNALYCTQCEAEGFRRITFYPDRPDVLSSFTTKITADKTQYPCLLSNGNLIDRGDSAHNRHWVVWEDPFKKPSYLFALVAGKLAMVQDSFVTCSGKTVDLRIYVEPGNEGKCGHAMASLKKAMRWDEEMYGREYDLDTFMIVAVSDFNMGAMENKGLTIFNAKYILASPETATDQDYKDVEAVIGHEYFHNWTGNRVTCRDWFQLSLKEGLTVFREQEFSSDMNSRDVCRIHDVAVLRTTQFPEDASGMAHPVRPASYQEINNFYTATIYSKGAEVIRMQHTLLGKQGFRRGMDLYFKRHDGQAVTIDDFVAAMEDANKVDFSQLMLWYSQAGTPLVTAKSHFKDLTLTITLSQSCPPTPENPKKAPFHIPIRIALLDKKGESQPIQEEILELREKEQSFQFKNLSELPLISYLRNFSAPIRLSANQNQEERLSLLRFETDGFAKWNMAQELAEECLHGLYVSPKSKWRISPLLIDAFRYVLQDESLDLALRAELLAPLGFEASIANLSAVDVDKIEDARDFYRQQLGMSLFEAAKDTYHKLHKKAEEPKAAAARKLRNICLWLLMKGAPEKALTLCQEQFRQANCMTDKIASFTLLANYPEKNVREAAIQSFYAMAAKEDLVLDKWFAICASIELPDTFERVQSLLQHPAFSLKNPNKVRALIGSFVQSNPRHFYAKDGRGFAFLADKLIALDAINPQVAARLVTPLSRWYRFDKTRASLMKKELSRLSVLDLSRDLKEVVSKSLEK